MPKQKKTLDIVARYSYKNESGSVIYQVVESRDGSKRVRSPDPRDASQWRWGRARWGIRSVPYRLPDILSAQQRGVRTLWVVPSERDVDDLHQRGITATCAIWDGEPKAGDWQKEWSGWLGEFSTCVVVARNDPPPSKRTARDILDAYLGQRRAQSVVSALTGAPFAASSIKCLTLPDINGTRVAGPAQWFDLGGTMDALKAAARSAPPWQCPDAQDECSLEELEEIQASMAGDGAAVRPPKLGAAAASYPSCAAGAQPSAPASSLSQRAVSQSVGGVPDADPRSLASLRGVLVSIFSDTSLDKFRRQSMIEDSVTAWLNSRGQLFYHAELRNHSMSLYFDSVDKTLSYVGRDFFGAWLSISTKINAASTSFKHLIARVASEAMAGDFTRGIVPEKYWARRGRSMYLSCGHGRMVRVRPESVETVDNGTDDVLFEEGRELDPWTLQEGPGVDPFEACRVFKTMSAAKPSGRLLLKLWTMSMPGHGEITKPILLLTGKGRSGKTMLARQIQRLYGLPDRAQMLSKEYKIDNFWTAADAGGMFCLDNADYFIDWLVGCLCTVATGASYTKRMNYKDNELITQRARCWCAVTGVRPYFAADFTVADRLLPVEMLPRAAKDTEEGDLFADMAANRDAGLTWICRAWKRALADDAIPPPGVNARHPDWGRSAYRLARAIGVEEQAVAALGDTEAAKASFSLANDALGSMMLDAFGLTGFKGLMTEMRELLEQRCEDFDGEKWSKEKIGKAIKDRLSQQLEAAFKMTTKDHSGRKYYTLTAVPEDLQTPSMWRVDGVDTQSAHVGGGARADAPLPPTSPTYQDYQYSDSQEENWDL